MHDSPQRFRALVFDFAEGRAGLQGRNFLGMIYRPGDPQTTRRSTPVRSTETNASICSGREASRLAGFLGADRPRQ